MDARSVIQAMSVWDSPAAGYLAADLLPSLAALEASGCSFEWGHGLLSDNPAARRPETLGGVTPLVVCSPDGSELMRCATQADIHVLAGALAVPADTTGGLPPATVRAWVDRVGGRDKAGEALRFSRQSIWRMMQNGTDYRTGLAMAAVIAQLEPYK